MSSIARRHPLASSGSRAEGGGRAQVDQRAPTTPPSHRHSTTWHGALMGKAIGIGRPPQQAVPIGHLPKERSSEGLGKKADSRKARFAEDVDEQTERLLSPNDEPFVRSDSPHPDRRPPAASQRKWYARRSLSWSSSGSSIVDSLSSAWTGGGGGGPTARQPHPTSSSQSSVRPLLQPLDNIQSYVQQTEVDFFPFPPLAPQKSSREVLERAYEVLHSTRLSLPRLEKVEKIASGDWKRKVKSCTAQLPDAPISILTDDGPFFRLLAPGFQSDDIQIPSLPPTSAGTCFWLNEKVLLTALSVVDAMRDTSANYEFCKVTTLLPVERIGDGLYPTSPYPLDKSQTLVLLNRHDPSDRVMLVEVVEPEKGLMRALAREDEDWELGVPFRDRRREMRPAPEKVHANLLQAHIFASCKANRVAHFLLTDTRNYIFGEIDVGPSLHCNFEDPLSISNVGRGKVVGVEVGATVTEDFRRVGREGAEGIMRVKKAIHFTAQDPAVFESLVYFLLKAYDETRQDQATGVDIWTPPPPPPPKKSGRRH